MKKQNWDEYLKAAFGDSLTEKDLEKMFLANSTDAFAIYQLRDHESTHDHRFLSMSQLQAAGLTVERTNYEMVYTGALHHSSGKAVPELLNYIFYRFNMERPEDFYGHSLSISDIVALPQGYQSGNALRWRIRRFSQQPWFCLLLRNLYTGKTSRFERRDILGILKDDQIPKWAQLGLEQFKQQKQNRNVER